MAAIVSPSEWRNAREDLLKSEKEATRQLMSLASKRRELPMVKVENPEQFKFVASGDKTLGLPDLFEGRKQLILYHFMLSDSDSEGCSSCSFLMDHIPHDQALDHLRSRETTFAATAPASISKVDSHKKRMGWTFPFYSSRDTFTNVDGTDITWKPRDGLFAMNCFIREGDDIYHTYYTTNRGVETILSTYALLDLTKMGRQEDGDEPARFKLHDKYK